MTGLVEQYANSLGWIVARTNVIVEGTLDVAFLCHAAALHAKAYGAAILDTDFTVVASGKGDDGGVSGVSRGLITMRQVADVDRDALGALRYRFVALFDNDYAGRNAFNLLAQVDTRIERFKDAFLLHPVMPAIGNGVSDRLLEATRLNLPYSGLDWEIEDLCSERILVQFERDNPGAILTSNKKGNFTHREIDRAAKPDLLRFFSQTGTLEDASQLLLLLKLMRGYLGVKHEFIQTQ